MESPPVTSALAGFSGESLRWRVCVSMVPPFLLQSAVPGRGWTTAQPFTGGRHLGGSRFGPLQTSCCEHLCTGFRVTKSLSSAIAGSRVQFVRKLPNRFPAWLLPFIHVGFPPSSPAPGVAAALYRGSSDRYIAASHCGSNLHFPGGSLC